MPATLAAMMALIRRSCASLAAICSGVSGGGAGGVFCCAGKGVAMKLL